APPTLYTGEAMADKLPEGTVTLLFTDVEKSTDLRTSRGDETAHALLQTQGELVRAQIGQHGGHEVKSMGDGFMVAFASARSAVKCAIDIQRALSSDRNGRSDAVRVRIGLHTGEAIKEDGDFYGRNVILAARIADEAEGGEILASSVVKAVTESAGDIDFDEVRDV